MLCYMHGLIFFERINMSLPVFLLSLIFLIAWAMFLGLMFVLHTLYVVGLTIWNLADGIFSQGVFLP